MAPKFLAFLGIALAAGLAFTSMRAQDTDGLTHLSLGDPKTSDAVMVPRGDLVHTRQLMGLDIGKGDFGFADLIGQLKGICRAHDATLNDVAKLNVYAASDDEGLQKAIQAGIESAWPVGKRPAVILAITPLIGDTKVAADAVIAAKSVGAMSVERFERDAATLPAGRDILYFSGRAARSGDLASATKGTMAELFAVLEEVGGTPRDVVQVKAFIQPMSDWVSAEREIESAFGELGAPPIVFVEWSSSYPAEIEMIAAAPDRTQTDEPLSFITPKADKPSPVYCRVVRVHSDRVIYTSGLYGTETDSPEAVTKSAFARLGQIAKAAGSDLRHLAKATYYVSDDEASKALNEIRPTLYDPARPPAASKVALPTVGQGRGGILMDFIAVPAAKPQP